MQLQRGKNQDWIHFEDEFFYHDTFLFFPNLILFSPSSHLCSNMCILPLNHGSITRFYYGMDQVALKAVPKSTTPVRDFLVEFHYSYFLSPHHGILDTYDVAFETPEYYVFAQEVAPLGDLWQVMTTFHSSTCMFACRPLKSWPIDGINRWKSYTSCNDHSSNPVTCEIERRKGWRGPLL